MADTKLWAEQLRTVVLKVCCLLLLQWQAAAGATSLTAESSQRDCRTGAGAVPATSPLLAGAQLLPARRLLDSAKFHSIAGHVQANLSQTAASVNPMRVSDCTCTAVLKLLPQSSVMACSSGPLGRDTARYTYSSR